MLLKASARTWFAPTFLIAAIIGAFVLAAGSGAQEPTITFAATGDHGADSSSHSAVADMITGWNPDFIITMGDNRYDVADYDPVIGRRYCDYLADAAPGPNCGGGTSSVNRFFPALGNHDYNDGNGIGDYLDYFTLPGNERNYAFVQGPVHFFVVDSGTWGSVEQWQADWLRDGLQASTSPWQIVYFHHAAYSSAEHGSNPNMQLDYAAWGADAVLAGHDHHYERIERDGIVYFVNGLGGRSIYGIAAPVAGSRFRYNADYGAMRITAGPTELTFEFRAVDGGGGTLIDSHTILADGQPPTSTILPPSTPTTSTPTTSTPNGSTSVPGSQLVEVRVDARGDDVEEIVDSSVLYLDSSDLELVDDSSYQGHQMVGLRFRGLPIPQGSTIVAAGVRFTADESDSVPTDLVIAAHDAANAWAFTGPGAVSGRAVTAATVGWNAVASWTAGQTYDSPDLRAVVQEIVGRGDWQAGNDLALIISGTGERTAASFDGNPLAAPLLRIEFATGPPPAASTTVPPTTSTPTTSTPPTTGTLDVRIAGGADDAEERTIDSAMYLDSSDLELVDDTSYNGLQAVGLRFTDLDLPAGATVTGARLRFVADESDGVATSLTIRGHDTGDAGPFGRAVGGLSGRARTTAAVRWAGVEPWTRGRSYDSPDLAPIIREIIGRGDWRAGNDLVLIISGTGERTAESYEGLPAAAPLLHIDYAIGGPAPSTTVPSTTVPSTTVPSTTVPSTTVPSTTGTTSSTTVQVTSVVDVRIVAGGDDVEESVADGSLYVDSSDIELVDDSWYNEEQVVGLRFRDLAIAPGATITRAELRFTADESDSVATNLTIAGHQIGDAGPFGGAGAVSGLPRTTAVVAWPLVEPWIQGGSYRSPDLRSVVQEIVDRGDWSSGNDLTLIISGTGERTAESHEGAADRAPLLHIEFTSP